MKPAETKAEKLPSDFEIKSMVFKLWYDGLNQEFSNIASCLASNARQTRTETFDEHLRQRLKILVNQGELRKARFLPGRPYYTIS